MYDYFVTINCNLSDDMDMFGFSFMTKDEVKTIKSKLKAKQDWFQISVGSNQEIGFQCGEELLDCLEFIKIKSEEDYKVLEKYIGVDCCSEITPEKVYGFIIENFYEEDLETYEEEQF